MTAPNYVNIFEKRSSARDPKMSFAIRFPKAHFFASRSKWPHDWKTDAIKQAPTGTKMELFGCMRKDCGGGHELFLKLPFFFLFRISSVTFLAPQIVFSPEFVQRLIQYP